MVLAHHGRRLDLATLRGQNSLSLKGATLQHLIEIETARGFFSAPGTQATVTATGEKNDALCTFSTSGTTGQPKLAVHDQHSIAVHATNVMRRADIRPGDVMLCTLPLYGVLGFRWIVALTRVPGIRQAVDAGYRVFARNRTRLTGRCSVEGGCATSHGDGES